MRPAEQHWWFDNQAGTPGEWVALLVYRAGPAEVLWNDARPGWFSSREHATGWLEQQGYLPAPRALAEHLVARVPPDVLPVARQKKRIRVEQGESGIEHSEPRVRVADTDPTPDVDDTLDELDERALAGDPGQDAPARARAAPDARERGD